MDNDLDSDHRSLAVSLVHFDKTSNARGERTMCSNKIQDARSSDVGSHRTDRVSFLSGVRRKPKARRTMSIEKAEASVSETPVRPGWDWMGLK